MVTKILRRSKSSSLFRKIPWQEVKRARPPSFLLFERPSLSRELAAMKREGLINYHKNLVSILDLKRLGRGYEINKPRSGADYNSVII